MIAGRPYPKRPPFYAQRVVRALLKACAAQTIGQDGCLLVAYVVATEDATHYKRPVSFYTGQLLPCMGTRKWETLDSARKRAVAAGWLVYVPPASGSRQPGLYWADIPHEFADLPDGPADDGKEALAAAYLAGYEDCRAGLPAKAYPPNGDGRTDSYPPNGYAPSQAYPPNGDGRGYGRGYGHGEPPSLTLTLNTSGPAPDGGDAAKVKPKRKAREARFSEEDLQIATWMWDLIRALCPDAKSPHLPKWANIIRLMRETDNRTPASIREVFSYAHQDRRFWFKNILSPDSLRKHFDRIAIESRGKHGTHATTGPASKPLERPVQKNTKIQEGLFR